MENSTIGDDISVQYEFDWQDGLTRTSDELGDFEEAGLDVTVEDVVDVARSDPDCEVRVTGIE
jgi:hypothetical protein